MGQLDILIRSLENVAGEAEGENGGWKIKLIIFVGGTSEVHVKTFNDNLKELQVIESKKKWDQERSVYELLNAQDTVLCSSFASTFAQRNGERGKCRNQGGTVGEEFQGLGNFE